MYWIQIGLLADNEHLMRFRSNVFIFFNDRKPNGKRVIIRVQFISNLCNSENQFKWQTQIVECLLRLDDDPETLEMMQKKERKSEKSAGNLKTLFA